MADHKLPGFSSLSVNLPQSLVTELNAHCERTSETVDHTIQRALAQALAVEHHTIYQVSTSTALVQGVYQGCVTVGDVKTHGDFGLGTYDSLDGEGLMLEGEVWQALSDGSVVKPDDSATAPFWACTTFEADKTETLSAVASWDDLLSQLDTMRNSQNLFIAFRIDGQFDEIHYRVACKASPGTDLVTATSHQAEFTLTGCDGTLMGFWTPTYAKTLNVPGYHLHLLTSDRQRGGHVLGIKARNLKVQMMNVNNVAIALPESPDFLKADLSADPTAALSKAEGAKT